MVGWVVGWPCEMGRVAGAGELLRRGAGLWVRWAQPESLSFFFLLSLILVFSLTNFLFHSRSVYVYMLSEIT